MADFNSGLGLRLIRIKCKIENPTETDKQTITAPITESWKCRDTT